MSEEHEVEQSIERTTLGGMYKTEQQEYREKTRPTLVQSGTQYNRKARRFKINDPKFTKKRVKRG